MDGAELRFARELRANITASIADRTDALTRGYASDYADYRNRVGQIEALRMVLDMAEAIEDKVSGRVTERGT